MTRLTVALKNLDSMAFTMYSSTVFYISLNDTEIQFFYYILDSILHVNFISTVFPFVSFFFFQLLFFSASIFSFYLQLHKFSSSSKHSTVLQNYGFVLFLHYYPLSASFQHGGKQRHHLHESPLLLVSYHEPIPQLSCSEALLMPLIT